MFRTQAVGTMLYSYRRIIVADETVASVGILQGVDKHHRVAQYLATYGFVDGRKQMVCCEHRSIGTAYLIAMHTVRQPNRCG